MFGRLQIPRDPFEGKGARRTHLRVQVEGFVALALAIAAVGLTLGSRSGRNSRHQPKDFQFRAFDGELCQMADIPLAVKPTRAAIAT